MTPAGEAAYQAVVAEIATLQEEQQHARHPLRAPPISLSMTPDSRRATLAQMQIDAPTHRPPLAPTTAAEANAAAPNTDQQQGVGRTPAPRGM